MNGKLSAIKIMEQETGKIKGFVSLAQGIPSFPSHPLIRERVIKAIESGAVDKYSPVAGLLELRELIGKELDNRYSPETVSSKEIPHGKSPAGNGRYGRFRSSCWGLLFLSENKKNG